MEFPISVGVHQGSALSPLLFVIVMDAITRDLHRAAPWTLVYADDVMLACEDKAELERQPQAWCDRLALFGLKLNVKKTVYLTTDVNEHGSIKINVDYKTPTAPSPPATAPSLRTVVAAVVQLYSKALPAIMKIRPLEKPHFSKRKKAPRQAGLLDVMRGAPCKDYALLFVGIVFSFINGAMLPMNSFVFQGMADTLISGERNLSRNDLDMDVFSSDVLFYCSLYLYLGIGVLALSYISFGGTKRSRSLADLPFSSMQNASLYTMCESRVHYLRAKYLRAVLRQDMEWFDHQQTGALTMKMSRYAASRRRIALVSPPIREWLNLAHLGGFAQAVFFHNRGASRTRSDTNGPLWNKSQTFFCKFQLLSRASKLETYAYSSAAALANEVIAGIRTVMAFNAQPYEIHRSEIRLLLYETELKEARKMGIRKAIILAVFAALPLFLMFAAMAIAFWYGTTLVLQGTVTPGTVFAVFWSVLIGTRRLGEAAPQMGVFMAAKTAAADIFAIIDRVPDIDAMQDDGFTPEEFIGRLTFSNVHFTYPARPTVKILDGISYEVNPGETVALVGHSGCGKSTMVGLLLRYYEQSAGVVSIPKAVCPEKIFVLCC
ncbi:unnamed protein product [Heligmosomoides polygyrus]|uniref:Reverse transcriptase domain-containing protein n=1 Tax=Heligmosomoides polygyrus TaxID=6339 RepID=A0A3P8AJB4_HELPZ|nr:unnamed protein product [Heligmosomoides polygyrus]